MNYTQICKAALVLLFCFTAGSCKKDKVSCSDDVFFCSLVEKEDFEATGPLIDEYLKGLTKGKDEKKLEMLASWLQCHSCVMRASVYCNSCVQTLPPQSELSVDFLSKGQLINKILDISMSDPMKYHRYHD